MDSHFFFNLQNKEKVNTIPGLEGASTRDQQQQPHLRRYNKLAETVFDRLQFNFKFLQKQKGHGRVVWLRISRRGRIVTNEFLNFPPPKKWSTGAGQKRKKRKTVGQENVFKIAVVSSR